MAPIAYGMTREIRTARRLRAAERLLRALGRRPGWRVLERTESWHDYLPHYPWLDAPRGTTVTGPGQDGHRIIIAWFTRLEQRRGLHWLLFCYEIPESVPPIRLEREWGAAALRIPVTRPGLYIPMASPSSQALTEHLMAGDLTDRLAALGAPAVSVRGSRICFIYHPLPDRTEVARYAAGLGALLPDLRRLARSSEEPQAAQETDGVEDDRGSQGARPQ
ncbi:hypothetical protein [Streptomyces sp. CB03911]|uniref:hypothetical protein n=1 Tax=Streptomyces sp. CB03911 TaxID=1804758 RepID=UPI00095D8D14|nr:hypothetical protein [Streptomyces sp. CB03911]OKI12552.1 hypothetical protein A6A07_16770 [Streptomyces sp. CB03911]